MKLTSPCEICIWCTFAQLSQWKMLRIIRDHCHREMLLRLWRRAAIKIFHFPFDLNMWTTYFQQEKKLAWFLTPITKTSCSYLSCFIMNPRGLKTILTHHVSLSPSTLFQTISFWIQFRCLIVHQTRSTVTDVLVISQRLKLEDTIMNTSWSSFSASSLMVLQYSANCPFYIFPSSNEHRFHGKCI